jgi:hypothetical protein
MALVVRSSMGRNHMAGEKAKIKVLTVQEANALLPQVRLSLNALRELKSTILRIQAQIEIEELTGSEPDGKLGFAAQVAIKHQMESIHVQTQAFEQQLELLFQLGAHLKDLDQGLIDFYGRRGTEVVFLCWKEGDDEVNHWHGLQGGFSSRQPL